MSDDAPLWLQLATLLAECDGKAFQSACQSEQERYGRIAMTVEQRFFTRAESGLDALHTKLDHALRALHYLLTRTPDMDHADLLAKAKDLDSAADTAVANFKATEAAHQTTVDALDDVGGILDDVKGKLAGITAPAASGSGSGTTTSVNVAVTSPTTAPEVTIPVSSSDASAVASALSDGSAPSITGAGIVPGTTVVGADPVASTITLSDHTTADHAGGETLTVTSAS